MFLSRSIINMLPTGTNNKGFLEDRNGNKSVTRLIMISYGWSGLLMSWIAFFVMIFYFKSPIYVIHLLISIMAVTIGHGIIKLGDKNKC